MRESLIEPLTGEQPCGTDAKYDDAYLAVEAEVDKSNSLADGVATDWETVCKGCETLLERTTKDLKLAAWWVYGRYMLGGAAVLPEALGTLLELLRRHGPALYPRSGRGKVNALSWLETLLTEELETPDGVKIPAAETEAYALLLSDIGAAAAVAAETEVSLFRDLVRRCESVAAELRRKHEAEERKNAAPAPSGLEGIESDADAVRMLNELKKSAQTLGGYWRHQNMEDPRALRMTRLMAWLEVEGLPPSENGRVPVNPPSAERAEQVETLAAEGKQAEAFELLEEMILRAPFWMEGHLRAFELLEAAGKSDAAAEVRHLLAAFAASHPGVTELSFRDGTPFAPSKVKTWLAEAMAKGGAPAEAAPESGGIEEIAERCYALVKKKKTKEAMALLQRSHLHAGAGEEKFEWRLLHAEVAVEAGKPEMAMALIEELEADIGRYRLEEWQPDLAARVYALLLTSFNRSQLEYERLESSYRNLCRVDTAGAIDIKLH